MRSVSVRNLADQAYEQLRIRAARHGVSMEEEIRQIIYMTVAAPDNIANVFQKHFGQQHGVDVVVARRKPHEPLDFDE